MASSSSSESSSREPSLLPTLATAAAIVLGAVILWRRRKNKNLPFSLSELQSLCLNDTSDCIYLDYNGTTPIHPLVLAAMLPFLTIHFGNPSSSHHFGAQPKLAIESARTSLLNLIGKQATDPTSSLWFTGCGTESDNLAIQLALQSNPPTKRHVVTTNVEHPAIVECLKGLANDISVTYVPVQPDGRVTTEDVISAIQDDTMLVTIMLANNESGALQPVKEVATACRKRGILMHTDAAQACGKVDLSKLVGDADFITLVGHKLGAPKGVAALYVREGCCNEAGRSLPEGRGILLLGGGQEGGRRGGTENVAYMAGMGKAADLAVEHLETNMKHMESMRTRLLENLREQVGSDIQPNGPLDPQHRLPNTLSIGIPGIVSGSLLSKIGDQVAASAGAACHSGGSAGKISAVLEAMSVPTEYARGTLRLSLGPTTTAAEIDKAATIIAKQVRLERAAVSPSQ